MIRMKEKLDVTMQWQEGYKVMYGGRKKYLANPGKR
jgi:hypothetical protein